MKIIVGLGNPGKQYEFTRHNIGFLVIDQLAEKWNIDVNRTKFKSLVGEGFFAGEKVLLVKPQTFMNLSGEAVLDILQFYKREPSDLLVVYDDMDLPPGKIRLRKGGGSGGHKGMSSIIYLINSEGFPRLRIGIGKPTPEATTVGHVLGKINNKEQDIYIDAVEKASNAVQLALEEGVEKAMNKVNVSSK